MEERISLEHLRSLINRNDLPCEETCRQISMDFAEMKKNSAQVICTVFLSHIVLTVSNSNLLLHQQINELAKKVSKRADKLRKMAGLTDLSADS